MHWYGPFEVMLTLSLGELPDARNVWIGNEESTTSLHMGTTIIVNNCLHRSLRESLLSDRWIKDVQPHTTLGICLSQRYILEIESVKLARASISVRPLDAVGR